MQDLEVKALELGTTDTRRVYAAPTLVKLGDAETNFKSGPGADGGTTNVNS